MPLSLDDEAEAPFKPPNSDGLPLSVVISRSFFRTRSRSRVNRLDTIEWDEARHRDRSIRTFYFSIAFIKLWWNDLLHHL